MQIWYQFRIKITAEIAPSIGAFLDEFSEQLNHQSMEKAPVLDLGKHFSNANKVQI